MPNHYLTKLTGYSLWLMPTGEVYNRLRDLISQLSKAYDSPYFEPHVTLLGELQGDRKDIISKTVLLVSAIKPFRIELEKVDRLDNYFRCLFVRAKETDGLIKANREARNIFGRNTDPEYMPHLSLLYGNLKDQTKQAIIADIGEEIRVGFDVNRIHLYSIDGEPKDWHRVEEFPIV